MPDDTPKGSSEGRGMVDKVKGLADEAKSVVANNKLKTSGVFLLLVFFWVFRPWFQPFWYEIRFKFVGTIIYAILTGLFAVGATSAFQSDRRKIGYALIFLVAVLVIITMGSPFIAGAYSKQAMSDRVTASTPETANISTAPAVEQNNTRTLTLKGASTHASTSFNVPTHRLTDGDLIMTNDEDLAVSYGVVPEGPYKSLVKKQKGAVYTPINTNEPNVTEVYSEGGFECGRGMLIFDDVKYKMQKDHMNTRLTNPTTFRAPNGEMYNMYSGIQHDLEFSMEKGIPMVYPVPEYNGVFLSDTDCNQEYLTPEEALNDSRLKGQQFYPYSLMKKEALATNFQYGWLNTITNQRGMKELPRTPSIENSPPYTMRLSDGSYGQVLTMEAIGGGTGVFEVYIGDGRTGEKMKYTFNTSKKGPSYAVNEVKAENPAAFKELTVSEIYPVFRNGELWYQANAVQKGSGVYSYTAFYNPASGELLKAYTNEQIKAFYAGSYKTHERPEKGIDVPSEGQQGRNVEDPSLWVNIQSNGETVHSVPVRANETVGINQTG